VFSDVHNGNLRRRIAVMGGVLIAAPLLTLTIAAWIVIERVSQTAMVASAKTSSAHLVTLTHHLVDICQSFQQSSVDILKSGRAVLDAKGPVTLDPRQRVAWRARDETSGAMSDIRLPVLSAGDIRLLPVADFGHAAPVVDEIKRMNGTAATIFERMDEGGDMLRISSSVQAATGERDIGSYLPVSAHGAALMAVLGGRSYIAQAALPASGFLTAYQPLEDQKGKVVGMLATAFSEEQITDKIRAFVNRQSNVDRVGLFAWRASGADEGTAVMMADHSLEGQNLWQRTDSSGALYVQQISTRALVLPVGETGEYQYRRPARVGAIPQTMVARFAYVRELDWVVGYAQPEADLLASAAALESILRWGLWLVLGLGLTGTGLAVHVWFRFAGNLAEKLSRLLGHLTAEAKQVGDAAVALSAEARRASGQTGAEQVLRKAGRTASEISLAIHHINASSDSVSGVMEAIEQIAFATNMLAVNSALEASHGASGGPGIAGIAADLRKLAERCREAARETQTELEQSRIELEKGSEEVLDLVKSSPPADETRASLERQAENLIQLAEGLGRTVELMSEYLESDALLRNRRAD
jgi:hypothetical protein